jgi:hypothetical protein
MVRTAVGLGLIVLAIAIATPARADDQKVVKSYQCGSILTDPFFRRTRVRNQVQPYDLVIACQSCSGYGLDFEQTYIADPQGRPVAEQSLCRNSYAERSTNTLPSPTLPGDPSASTSVAVVAPSAPPQATRSTLPQKNLNIK